MSVGLRSEKGELLQKRYKDFFADNFFDPRLDVTFLKTIELIPNEAQRTKVNPDIALDMLYSTEPEPFGILQADYYTDIEETGIHTECECYDMSATLANFSGIPSTRVAARPSGVNVTPPVTHLTVM